MLKSYKDHLKKLSDETFDDFARRIHLRLQFHLKDREIDLYAQSIRNLIVSMPELADQIHAWSKEAARTPAEKKFIESLAAYLYHPLDLVPYRTAGLFGYLEDAYLTGRVFQHITQSLSNAARNTLSISNPTWVSDIPRWLSMTEKVIPAQARRIDNMLNELILTHQPVITNQETHEMDKESFGNRIKSAVNSLIEGANHPGSFEGRFATN